MIMKRLYTFFLIFLMALPIYSQRTIQMEYTNGVYRIPCTVNGANMKMIFDTGASTVSISLATALFLYQNGYINDNDFKESGRSSTASGEIVDHMKINIRDIEIGGLHLNNVEGVVIESLNAPLLLGQTAIQKLGSITISGNKLVINNARPIEKKYSSKEVFDYYDYKIKKSLLVMEIESNVYEYINSQSWTSNRKQNTLEVIKRITAFINSGNCNSYNNGRLNFTGSVAETYVNYLKQNKKSASYAGEAAYYINLILKKLVDQGKYLE